MTIYSLFSLLSTLYSRNQLNNSSSFTHALSRGLRFFSFLFSVECLELNYSYDALLTNIVGEIYDRHIHNETQTKQCKQSSHSHTHAHNQFTYAIDEFESGTLPCIPIHIPKTFCFLIGEEPERHNTKRPTPTANKLIEEPKQSLLSNLFSCTDATRI